MKYKKILVVYKKPLLDIYKKKSKKELEKKITEEGLDIEDLEAEKREDVETRNVIEPILKADKEIKVDWKYRAKLSKKLINKYDLIMTFGGDGTLMEASHYIDDKSVFGINSDYRPNAPDSSEGFFLSANKHDFPEKYKALQEGKLKEYKFNRLQAELNNKKLEELILNDITVSDLGGFGDTARIILKDKEVKEFQKIDGLIIATAASNWAIRHGGEVLPITSDKVSYVTVGLYIGRLNPNPKLETGVTDCVEVYSKMREGILKLDGKHIKYPFGLGAKLKVYPAAKPLSIIGFNEENREKYYTKKVSPKKL